LIEIENIDKSRVQRSVVIYYLFLTFGKKEIGKQPWRGKKEIRNL